MKLLVICTSSLTDIEAYNSVIDLLSKSGIEVLLFKQDKCFEGEYISVLSEQHSTLQYTFHIDGASYTMEDFFAVWYMKPSVPRVVYDSYKYEYANFISKQFYSLREGIRLLYGDKFFLNDPRSELIAENKIYQLEKARKVGLAIPETLISNDPEEIVSFYNKHKKIIAKSLCPTIILDHVIYTHEILQEHINGIESARFAPCIYQKMIEKNYELRVTVVGQDIFACKIFSQEDENTSIDWRTQPVLNDFEVRMEETTLPASLQSLILSYMREVALNFGCIDLIVTKQNEFIFLEINPNGQWAFVQSKTGMNIARTIADCFINKIPISAV